MDEKRNLVLAAVLAIAILFGWPFISNLIFPQANPPAVSAPAAPAEQAPAAQGTAAPDTTSAQGPVKPVAEVLAKGQRIPIETPRLKGSINLVGGRIDDLVLPDYRQTVDKNSPPVRLFAPAGAEKSYFAGFGWSAQGIRTPDANSVWSAQGSALTPKTPVTLSWDNGQGQRFRIRLAVDENYMLTVAQTIENGSASAISARSFGFLSRIGQMEHASTWTIHTGPIGVFNNAADYSVDFKDLDKSGTQRFASTGGWVGFTDLYWHAALIPAQDKAISAQFRAGSGERYQADMSYGAVNIPAGKAVTTTSRLFAGAKETSLLEHYTDKEGVTLFDRAIDWGWFRWFEKPIFYVLDWLFRAIGNFGVAIICLTFIVRGIMFPVAQRQFASMAAMRAIQPKMKALQEKYKDDKPKAQQAIMELYKTEKVNPLNGCLPIFLQIPIFFALYKVLQLTIEMRHQPFVLWIKDLSAPDPLHILNLFGLLPFTPPSFLGIGVLALLLGITMYLQFKLNPAPMDETQKQIFAIMPWMMMFIMGNGFASGLLIYWCTSNMLTIAQQWWLYRQHPGLKEPAAVSK